MPTTTMQIRTRRRRGRKISRGRPRKLSLSRRRSKSRSGGKLVGVRPSSSLLARSTVHTKANEVIGAHIALARELVDDITIKNYLSGVKELMIAKLGGQEKLDDAILAAAEAAEAAAARRGGAPGDEDTPPRSSEEVPLPDTVFTNIRSMIPQRHHTIGGINVALLVGLIFMLFMIDGADARVIRSRVSTPALDNMLNPYDPSRPGQIWSFWNALFALFGYGPGAWGYDPLYYWQGPPRL